MAEQPYRQTARSAYRDNAPEEYRRYLVNALREAFALSGAPIRLQFRGTSNPYAE